MKRKLEVRKEDSEWRRPLEKLGCERKERNGSGQTGGQGEPGEAQAAERAVRKSEGVAGGQR